MPRGAPPSTTENGAQENFTSQVGIGGGRKLYIECHGTGGPTVILESGYHDSSQPWSLADGYQPAVMPRIARFTRVCAYDRPGTLLYTDPPRITDRSSPVKMPRTAQDITSDLHALLGAAQIPGPYILVAHSMGGLFMRLYAQNYPDCAPADACRADPCPPGEAPDATHTKPAARIDKFFVFQNVLPLALPV